MTDPMTNPSYPPRQDSQTQNFAQPPQPQQQYAPPAPPLSDAKRHRNATIIWLVAASFLLLSSSFFVFQNIDIEGDDLTANEAVFVMTRTIVLVLGNVIGVIAVAGIVHLSLRLAKKA